MSQLDLIGVQIEQNTGNMLPLLHEIRHALERLLESGEATVIDLRSIPLAPGEEERIEETLGTGEVHAELNAIGPSTICETAIPGTWLITHRNSEDELVGKFIEVSHIPEILKSQVPDIEAGKRRLEQTLEQLSTAT